MENGFDYSRLAHLHRSHDFSIIEKRIRDIAKRLKWRRRVLARVEGKAIYLLDNFHEPGARPRLLLSAGIHGDEPAGPEAVLSWLESRPALLKQFHFLIMPCLNPWGVMQNSRADAQGRDLNRMFHNERIEEIRAYRKEVERSGPFNLAITFHEDYDGQGMYLYELKRDQAAWGEDIMKAVGKAIPIEPRSCVDRRRQRNGVVRRRVHPRMFAKMGYPEAVYLYFHHCSRVYTFETPSEFELGRRVCAHQLALESACGLLKREWVKARRGLRTPVPF